MSHPQKQRAGGIADRWQKLPNGIVLAFAFVICAALGVASLFLLAVMQKEYFDTTIPEQLILSRRNVLHVLPGVALPIAILAVFAALGRSRVTWKTARAITALAAALQMGLGFWWRSSFKSVPYADQRIVWSLVVHAVEKTPLDAEEVAYLRDYPYQTSAAMLMEPFARIFGCSPGKGYESWQVFSVLCLGAIVAALCCICGKITDSPTAQSLCAILAASFVSLPMYTTFVYGTLPGLALGLWGMYAVLCVCTAPKRKSRAGWLALAVVLLSFSMIVYVGYELFLIASVLVLLATGLFRKEKRGQIASAVILLALPLTVSGVWKAVALSRFGLPNYAGCPLLARVAMGIDTSGDAPTPGFYTELAVKIFEEADYDVQTANALAWQSITDSLTLLHSEKQLIKFFAKKTIYQWLAPWFGGLTMNNPSIFGEPKWLVQEILNGSLFNPIQTWLGLLMPVIYLGAAGGTLSLARRDRKSVWRLLLAVCLIGGFLFQLISEAKPRYCMPYYLCCFPLAAAGLTELGTRAADFVAAHRAGKSGAERA